MRCSSPALSHLLWLAWPGSTLPTQARFMPPMALDPMQGPSPTVGANLRSQSRVGWAHPQALSTSNWTCPTLSGHAFDSPGSMNVGWPPGASPINFFHATYLFPSHLFPPISPKPSNETPDLLGTATRHRNNPNDYFILVESHPIQHQMYFYEEKIHLLRVGTHTHSGHYEMRLCNERAWCTVTGLDSSPRHPATFLAKYQA
ncbi:hypothetical protein B0H10DRAFT_1940481 [Mycena sp. CBHHK59/15]|nr:hypothetical protein B0H10DRAFT_1940481 [Mycena sp. CBHHK59/15]